MQYSLKFKLKKFKPKCSTGSSNQTQSSVEHITLPTSPKAAQQISIRNPVPVPLDKSIATVSDSDATIESIHSSPIRDDPNDSSDDDVQEIVDSRSRSR